MSSLSDILTTAKNIVTAVNGAAQNYLNVQGAQSLAGITSATVVKASSGRVAVVSVVVAGSAAGAIYDANFASATTNKLWTIPTTIGLTTINLPTNYGIVVAPGTGQTIAISYS
jgi:hypothetical protein